MKNRIKPIFGLSAILFSLLLIGEGCTTSKRLVATPGKVRVTFIQMNDVYEIAPLAGGKVGGMARVGYLSKKIKAANPNSFLIMAGDFLSPSIYNTLKVDGVRVRGRQMVDVMNAAGTDYVMFGNHEFDITENELQQRINESKFKWISSNTFQNVNGKQKPFNVIENGVVAPMPEYRFVTVKDPDGTSAKIGFIAVTLPFNKADYVIYTDPLSTAVEVYNRIKDSCDVVVAITHQAMEDDIRLAERIPQLGMIMGGHEHDMRIQLVGNVWITKAHSNVRTVYINEMIIDKATGIVEVRPKLTPIDDKIPFDSITEVAVHRWVSKANANFTSLGFDPNKVILSSGEPLEGRESLVRSKSTNLTQLVVKAMEYTAPLSEVAIVNSGSIRVDDVLQMPLTQYDILRTMPFGGSLVEVEVKGDLLKRILTIGVKNRGTGGFLQFSTKITTDSVSVWKINNVDIDDNNWYRVVFSDFLLTGGESNLGFLTMDNPGIRKVTVSENPVKPGMADIRLAIVNYLSR